MKQAPIVLFVYNRPWHTEQTLKSLMNNDLADQSVLVIYADGPKSDASSEDLKKINEVRKIIRKEKWCKEVRFVESDVNKGLANSVVDGVTETVNQFGSVIVLEDDLQLSPKFLAFMNKGLEVYRESENVYSINGYMFPIETALRSSVLLPYTSSWGWATWKEKWAIFDFDASDKEVITHNHHLNRRFNLANYDYATMLLTAEKSWAIKWYYAVFKRNGLGVFPAKSLVKNIGFDGSGEHHTTASEVKQYIEDDEISIVKTDKIDLNFYVYYLTFFDKENQKGYSFLKRIMNKILSIIKV